MSDNRKYYYLKLKENFYNSETMVILESMQVGLLYSNLLLKMYLMSSKAAGILMLNDHLPHTPQTIATFTRHQVGTVERALKVFLALCLVEILTDGAYYMADHPIADRPVLYRGGTEKERAYAVEASKTAPIRRGGHLSHHIAGGTFVHQRLEIRDLDIRDKSIENRESESAPPMAVTRMFS